MADVRTATQEFQGQILDTIRKSQEAVTDAIRTWAETVQSIHERHRRQEARPAGQVSQ